MHDYEQLGFLKKKQKNENQVTLIHWPCDAFMKGDAPHYNCLYSLMPALNPVMA